MKRRYLEQDNDYSEREVVKSNICPFTGKRVKLRERGRGNVGVEKRVQIEFVRVFLVNPSIAECQVMSFFFICFLLLSCAHKHVYR